MKINRNNYETFFIDYLDGKLDEKLVNDFIEFLQQNPDLKQELSMFGAVSVHHENITFNKKEKLYKESFDLENEFNRAAVAKLEGDLTETENTGFETYLAKHPEKQKEAELFSKTKLTPDESVVFSQKNKLYRKTTGKTILLWTVRIAAVLILAFVIYNLAEQPVNSLSEENKTALAENEIKVNEIKTETVQPITKNAVKNDTTLIVTEVIKSETDKTEPTTFGKSHEITKKTVEIENLITERIPIEIPSVINPMRASIKVESRYVSLALADYKVTISENPENEERLLADVVKEKTGINNLTLGIIKKAGLNLIAGFTNDNFSYEITEDGRISEISFDSRLLAFTIPTGNE